MESFVPLTFCRTVVPGETRKLSSQLVPPALLNPRSHEDAHPVPKVTTLETLLFEGSSFAVCPVGLV